jgi:predicted component of type VI protein secretion system
MRIESYKSFLLAASCIVLSACSSTPSSSSSISDAELERVRDAISSPIPQVTIVEKPVAGIPEVQLVPERELVLIPSISPSLERACAAGAIAVLAGTRNPQEPTSTPIVPSSALVKLPEVLLLPEASKELPSRVRSIQSCE